MPHIIEPFYLEDTYLLKNHSGLSTLELANKGAIWNYSSELMYSCIQYNTLAMCRKKT